MKRVEIQLALPLNHVPVIPARATLDRKFAGILLEYRYDGKGMMLMADGTPADFDYSKLEFTPSIHTTENGQPAPMDYIPYNDGAGPSEEHNHHNNLVLLRELHTQGFNVHLCSMELDDTTEAVVVAIGDNLYEVNYDRWGYVCDGTDIDQTNLEDTVKLLKEMK
jgi:hypothetical protein